MENKKGTGSFYTPKVIADFLVDHIAKKTSKQKITVLEPSAGDGIFVEAVYSYPKLANAVKQFVAIERDKIEYQKVLSRADKSSLVGINEDFLNYQKDNPALFDIVIGNPPYIRKSHLSEKQKALCTEIHQSVLELSKNSIKNIWTAFLIRCINFVSEDGILAFILPSELLQVKFAAELRTLILKEFDRVEIFTFNELLFKDCKGQDTVILIGERKAQQKGVFYANIDKVEDLPKKQFQLSCNINIRESKWTHHHLTTDEIELLQKFKSNLKIVNNYCSSKAGIVTAANDYFILDAKTVEEYELSNVVKKIVQKGAFVNGSVILGDKEFDRLIEQSKPTFLMSINSSSDISPRKIQEYLDKGIELKIDLRYKSSLRKNWYEVPNVMQPAEALFFKRCNEYPKFIKNDANVLTTDSAYCIKMGEEYNSESFIYSFYNSVTLAFAELNGRYYGGGVLELTPNEFKSLPVPYVEITNKEFKNFAEQFKNKTSIADICRQNDDKTLRSVYARLDSDTLNKLLAIRDKLYQRRMKTN